MKKIFKDWNHLEDETWRQLAQRQLPNLRQRASSLWLDGFGLLQMSDKGVPDFDEVSQRLQMLSGWQLQPTSQVYADGETWFQMLKRKELMVSDYIRPVDSLDYTPLPDAFHDAFGHVPFFTNRRFADMVSAFTTRILQAPQPERAALGRIWWYSIEFGLIREQGQLKALGAGLVSSFAELNRAFEHEVTLEPFVPDRVAQIENSPHAFHQTLFVLEALDELENCIKNWTIQTERS